MRFEVHALFGAAVAGVVCRTLPAGSMCLGVITAGMVIGSVIPDIDSVRSKVSGAGIISGAVSILAETTFGHRGLFHTPVFFLALSAAWSALLAKFSYAQGPMMLTFHGGLSFLIGYALHIFVDLSNEYGIMLLYPFSRKRFHFRRTVTGNAREARIFAVLVLFCVFLYFTPAGIFGFSADVRTFVFRLLEGSRYYVLNPYGLNL